MWFWSQVPLMWPPKTTTTWEQPSHVALFSPNSSQSAVDVAVAVAAVVAAAAYYNDAPTLFITLRSQSK